MLHGSSIPMSRVVAFLSVKPSAELVIYFGRMTIQYNTIKKINFYRLVCLLYDQDGPFDEAADRSGYVLMYTAPSL